MRVWIYFSSSQFNVSISIPYIFLRHLFQIWCLCFLSISHPPMPHLLKDGYLEVIRLGRKDHSHNWILVLPQLRKPSRSLLLKFSFYLICRNIFQLVKPLSFKWLSSYFCLQFDYFFLNDLSSFLLLCQAQWIVNTQSSLPPTLHQETVLPFGLGII